MKDEYLMICQGGVYLDPAALFCLKKVLQMIGFSKKGIFLSKHWLKMNLPSLGGCGT